MKTHTRIFAIFVVLALAILACDLPSTGGGGGEPGSKVLFSDDFSKTSSGWKQETDTDGVTDYANGGYRIFVNVANWYFWSRPRLHFSDVSIEVDATKAGGPDENDIGIICRYVDESNFYFLTIGSDGYYGISKFKDGEESLVGMDQYQFNDTVIRTGSATNHLKVDCVGSSLSLSANGTTLAQVTDADFASGDVGLIAGTYDTPGTDILFDNFVVSKP